MNWIKISDELPPIGSAVLLAVRGMQKAQWGYFRDPKYCGPKAAKYQGVHGVISDVTHWMPLPAPPDEER